MVELNKIPHIDEISNHGAFAGAGQKKTATFRERYLQQNKVVPSLEEAIRLNDLALFSSHALTQAQRASALKFYADTRGSLKKNVKWYRRVWIKWVQCLY